MKSDDAIRRLIACSWRWCGGATVEDRMELLEAEATVAPTPRERNAARATAQALSMVVKGFVPHWASQLEKEP